jgi:hypothetical protein
MLKLMSTFSTKAAEEVESAAEGEMDPNVVGRRAYLQA